MRVSGCGRISGRIFLPGDKSISHRLAMLAAIARGKTEIENFATSADCQSTLSCLRKLGVGIEQFPGNRVLVQGRALHGLLPPGETMDAGNSGSTIRMLAGILAGQPFVSRISGDASLCRRPMKRIIVPLSQMGAQIEAREDNFPPLQIQGRALKPIDYVMPVASAQVKTAVLLAGLYADGITRISEPTPTRNHTELAMREFGLSITVTGNTVAVRGEEELSGLKSKVPGDISSAAFFLVAATLLPHSELLLENVGLNPGRRGIIDLMNSMGANIEILRTDQQGGEPVADLRVTSAMLRGGKISGEQIPGVIDEIPILAILGTKTEEGLEIRDARELRVKESDRIRTVVDNLRRLGARVEEFEDGLRVEGCQNLTGTRLSSYDDHRIAMAFAVAGLAASGETIIEGAECAGISYPDFFTHLQATALS